MAKTGHKKPTGQSGLIKFISKNNKLEVIPDPIIYPEKKDEIESQIFNKFIVAMKDELSIIDSKQNKENDYDFSIETKSTTYNTDLAEIVFGTNGNPYTNKIAVNVGEYVISVLDLINKKATHYPNSGNGVILILYITHWRFQPLDIVIELIRYKLKNIKINFSQIYFVWPIGKEDCKVYKLYPYNIQLKQNANLEEIMGSTYYNLDPIKWETNK